MRLSEEIAFTRPLWSHIFIAAPLSMQLWLHISYDLSWK